MDIKDNTDVIFSIQGQVNFLWNIYIISLLALAGWLFSRKEKIHIIMKIIMSIIAILLISSHLWTVSIYHKLANAFMYELIHSPSNSHVLHPETLGALNYLRDQFGIWDATYWLFHGIVDVILFLAIWYDRIWFSVEERQPDS